MLDIRVFIGRITKDPDIYVFGDNAKLARITVAVDSDRKNVDGERMTEFVECKAWGSTANFIENYITKRRLVAIVGRTVTESWEDKNYLNEEGKPIMRYKSIVYIDTIYPLDSPNREGQDAANTAKPHTNQPVKSEKVQKMPTW